MQFRILGPLEVTADETPVAVGGPKPRALLAALLVAPRTIVSADRLTQVLWGDDPPPEALNALRAYVSRLRAALRDPARLVYRTPGYALEVTDDEVDAAQFVRLLGIARGHAATGEYERVVEVLDEALALWRGDVLAEFADLDFAVSEIVRLDELRLVAVEERIEALLQLDRDVEVVTELDGLVRRFPVRERLTAQLMRALYRTGRQSDALDAYRRLRARLVEDLGVEPSPQTQEVHRQVLVHDRALAPSRAPTGGNLPRRPTSFVGRDTELARLGQAVSGGPLVTLTGVGGVGKSRLAVEVAAHHRADFPDGVWLCELAPLAETSPVGQAVAAALGVQQREGRSMEQTVIEYLRARSMLLVLDNCEHVLPAAARLVAEVVAHCPGVVVLATSREALGVEGEQVWPVPPLSVDAAAVLFVHRARSSRPGFDPGRELGSAVLEICRRLDGLPLAIELAAARMRMMTAAEVAQRLDDSRLLTGGPRTVQPRHQSLTAAIDWSYRLLTDAEQRLFARMSVFASGADLAAVRAVCSEPDHDDDGALDRLTGLVDKSMVAATATTGGTRYLMLATLRSFGRQRLRERGEDLVLARRHATYFTELAEAAAAGVQGPDERAWVDRTLPERDNLRVAFDQLVADHDPELALRLVTSLAEVLHLRVGYESAIWAEHALQIAPIDHPLFVVAAGVAARGAWNRGDFAGARHLAARAGDRSPARGTARIAYPADVLADVALYEGDLDFPLRHWTAEVATARRCDDPLRLVWTLYYVAVCHAVRREPWLGVAAALESVQVADQTGNPTARSMARYALGLVRKKTDPEVALALLDEAAALAAQVRNFWWHGIAMMEAAATRAVHGDPAEAARALVDVLDHWDRTGDRTQQWLNLRYVARLLVRIGAHAQAAILHRSLVAAGRPSPVRLDLDAPPGPVLDLDGAVGVARSTLSQWAATA
ncbi:Predicted ATPase [Nakamurella panacisegetis]|uniref:Predicted ATPase n=1 Tax=Nakamurella panacisegetis TaxID=1090615 RepID=A0A1H0LNX3_9ACTN|nr:BTAD domain-containing putative transcriptional regulator [Nakamurella panacisegetis]SDO69721.1 Predicted ATPase [Nakamurella panacisegetis]